MNSLAAKNSIAIEIAGEPRSAGCDVPALRSPPPGAPQPAFRGSLASIDAEFLDDNGRELLIDLLASPVEADIGTVADFTLALQYALVGINGLRPSSPTYFLDKARAWSKFDRNREMQTVLVAFVAKWDAARFKHEQEAAHSNAA